MKDRTCVPIDARWLGGIENATEMRGARLTTLEGALPPGIRGVLYRNGPGLFERAGERRPHWFDGNGGILRLAFDGQGVTADYRFIRTEAFEADERAGRFTVPMFDYLPEGTPLERTVLRSGNAANTNVWHFEGRLLALYDGGRPVELNPTTLDTVGEVSLGGLEEREVFGAHPRPFINGQALALSATFGPGGGVCLLVLDRRGDIAKRVPLPGMRMPPHDFIDAGPFLVLVEPAVSLDVVSAMLGLRSVAEAMASRQQGRIFIIDKQSLEVIVSRPCQPLASFHYGSAKYDPVDKTISFLAFVGSGNDPSGLSLRKMLRGHKQAGFSRPTRVHLDPKTARIVRVVELANGSAELPVDDPNGSGVFCVSETPNAGFSNRYLKVDRHLGIVDSVVLPDGTYGNEPTVCVDSERPYRRWLVTVQYASRVHQSQLVVYDADSLSKGPVCRMALPEVVPFGFHGQFVPYQSRSRSEEVSLR
jgi:carotenoid cleavage dioxygenase-like enzyme